MFVYLHLFTFVVFVIHDVCVTCAKKCAVAMGANILNRTLSAFTTLFVYCTYLITYFLHLNCLSVCYSHFFIPLIVCVCFLSFLHSLFLSLFLLQVLPFSSFLIQCLTLYGFHSLAGRMCFPCQSSKRC